MRLKYYLRGLGIGIIVTTIILAISFSGRQETLSDEEIIDRATQLGMVMPEEDTQFSTDDSEESTEDVTSEDKNTDDLTEEPASTEPSTQMDTQQVADPQQLADTQQVVDTNEQNNQEGVYRLQIQSGDVCRTVCENLQANGVIEDAEALRSYLFQIGYASSISTGEYDVPYGLTMEEVAIILQNGPIE